MYYCSERPRQIRREVLLCQPVSLLISGWGFVLMEREWTVTSPLDLSYCSPCVPIQYGPGVRVWAVFVCMHTKPWSLDSDIASAWDTKGELWWQGGVLVLCGYSSMSAGAMPMFRCAQGCPGYTEKYAGALSETKVECSKTIIVIQICKKECAGIKSDYTAYNSIIPFFLLFLFPFLI